MVTTRSRNWLFSASRPPSRPPRPPRSPRPWPRSPRSPRRAPPRAVVSGSRRSGLSCRSSYSFSHLNVLFVIFGHSASPPSRAPSATAATGRGTCYHRGRRRRLRYRQPWHARRRARRRAWPWRSCHRRMHAGRLPAWRPLATVRPLVSSTTWTNTWRAERLTTRRGRTAVPAIRLRRRSWRRLRWADLLLFVRFLLIAIAMVTYQPFRPCGGRPRLRNGRPCPCRAPASAACECWQQPRRPAACRYRKQ